jgi:hypothetical protein
VQSQGGEKGVPEQEAANEHDVIRRRREAQSNRYEKGAHHCDAHRHHGAHARAQILSSRSAPAFAKRELKNTYPIQGDATDEGEDHVRKRVHRIQQRESVLRDVQLLWDMR